MLFQSIPLKKGCFFISSTPFIPNLVSHGETILKIKFSASGDKFASDGIEKCSFHFTIFLQVSLGFSLKNGGNPTTISKNITPIDHQSASSP